MKKIPPIVYHFKRRFYRFNHAGERYVSADHKKLETVCLDVVDSRIVPQVAVCVPEQIEQWREAHLEIDKDQIEHVLR